MSDQDTFERFISGHVADDGSGVVEARRITASLGELIDDNRQRPRWLALIKESPMRYESRLAAGSPAVRAAAILAATMLIALTLIAAGVAGQRLLAADGVIIVAQDGSGDHETIAAAVTAAPDGAEIRIRPGTYVESVAIVGKDLTITGEGERDEIVLEQDADAQPADIDWSGFVDAGDDPPTPALLIHDAEASLAGMTVVTPDDGEAIVSFGAGTVADLSDLTVRSLGGIPSGINAAYWEDGASGSLRRSHIEGWVGINQDTTVTIEDNEMPAVCLGVWAEGADAVIRNNTIHDCSYEKGIEIEGGNTVLLEGNDIMASDIDLGPALDVPVWGDRSGISVSGGADVTIVGNTIHDSGSGITFAGAASALVTDNRIIDSETHGIRFPPDGAIVSRNTIVDNGGPGLLILAGTLSVEDNEISGNDVGLFLGRNAAPAMSGNTICDNATDVEIVAEIETPPDFGGNEVCGDIATS